jgi:hypothetical protein
MFTRTVDADSDVDVCRPLTRDQHLIPGSVSII